MRRDEGAGYFGLIAAEDDADVFATLFTTAEAWLKERGCRRALGPFNLSVNEETGLLVDGAQTPPMIIMGLDPPYVGSRIVALLHAGAKGLFRAGHGPIGDKGVHTFT